jgi:hypothetical protein
LVRPREGQPARPLPDIVLTDEAIHGLSQRTAIVNAFPFVRLPNRPARHCGKCGQKRQVQAQHDDYNRIKNALVLLPAVKQEELKRLLGVAKVSLYLRDGDRPVLKSF